MTYQVLAVPTVNRDEVLKSIRQHAKREEGTRWVIVGGVETPGREAAVGSGAALPKGQWEQLVV